MRERVPITAIISTKNEQTAIGGCIDSLADFDEVIVVDSVSTDDTVPIASSKNIHCVEFRWDGFYPKKKQWCLENVETRNDWILFVDADERVPSEMIDELHHIDVTSNGITAFDIELDYVWQGSLLKHGHRVRKRALLDRRHTRFPVVDDLAFPGMGELEGHYQPNTDGTVATLRTRLLHHDPDGISTWILRHNKYSDWEAHLHEAPGTRLTVRGARSKQGRVFDKSPLKPLAFFTYSFVLRAGFRDGRAGFDYAVALSFYYWLIGVKVSELRGRDQPSLRDQ